MTRFGWVTVTYGAVLVTGITALFHPTARLIWNASASVPIGLYAVHPAGTLRAGELLVVTPPGPLATFLDKRNYLPKGIPLLKHVAALPGQTVCRMGDTISIDGITVGVALDQDHLGRSLPVWQGCRVIAAGEVFLMNPQSVASLDGRYFGPLPITTIVGRADPIWIKEAP
jgi:conjugative transfer signal peptidase TraF